MQMLKPQLPRIPLRLAALHRDQQQLHAVFRQIVTAIAALLAVVTSLPVFSASQSHALLIGVGQYTAASESAPLLGVPKDLATARRMAIAMGVPSTQIVELRDAKATKANIMAALQQLRQKAELGDRVFIYFSGHGTSYTSPKGCEQGFIPYTEGRHTLDDVITEAELASYTSKIAEKADKAIVMVDACFSGGLGAARTRSLSQLAGMRPKVTARSGDQCSVAVNQLSTTRSFMPAMQRLGVPEQNFVQISAANQNEVSWDNEELGGLATHTMGQCLLGEAQDLNRSGAITLDEVRACAQTKLNALMEPHRAAGMLPSNIQVRGSRNLIVVADPPKPTAVPSQTPLATLPGPTPTTTSTAPALAQSAPDRPMASAPALPSLPSPTGPNTTQAPTPVAMAEVPVETLQDQLAASRATLDDILSQRNGKLKLDVQAPRQLTIKKDPFRFTVTSGTDGYLYAVMLGSDGKSFYLLYPNKLDRDNKIKANTRYTFPRPGWSITAGGPAGTNQVLFVVTPSPRDQKIFVPNEDSGGGAFTFAVADVTARQRLVDFFVGRGVQGRSGQMAATLVKVEEVQ
ncbi:MAG: DUF4384 domain-containing protein [Sphingomonadaceae bacterium]|nr:DUF4384 domain-containing protein [Sphingomonadaceae bacterium]